MDDAANYLLAEIAHIRASGVFFTAWYLARHPDLAASQTDPVAYFCATGWRQGDQPNPYFDPAYYNNSNQDVAQSGVNPLLHYLLYGDKEGRNPSPYFDVKWYRAQYLLAPEDVALKHFLERRFSGEVAPVPVFDAAYYLETNPDVATAGADPFEHFLAFGEKESRDPAPDFDIKFYLARYGSVLGGLNPLLHYLANRAGGQFMPARPDHEKLIPGAVRRATRPSPYFEEFRPVPANAERRARLLAYYLPQFHGVPENDAWWGKGFTDWTNLARGVPRFAGHLQPRVPRDLGFYDLADPQTLRRQIEMARGAGLSGFVFYFYWFNGKRLLEGPLHALLADLAMDFPFCVMWANENFTRRWDGLEREVLLAQEYREADDAALVASFAALFTDPRYIRVQGRPLLMLYRAGLVPDAAKRIAKWRGLFRDNHHVDPVIVMAQSLGDHDPRPYGLDGAVEFPPHKISDEVPRINARLDLFDPEFSAAVYDYGAIAEASCAAPAPDYPLIKSIAPGWDNDPRREGRGLVLHDATPAKYQSWLETLVKAAAQKPFFGERLICVNAWNEWAEGAFLEPDIHFGAAFLNATGRALCATAAAQRAILLVGHDAHPHGAQLLLLHLARHYRRVCGFDVHILLLGAGPLVPDYQKTASVTLTQDKAALNSLLTHYHAIGIRTALVNSAASARLVPALAERGITVTLLMHEMPMLLAEYNLQVQARLGALAADHVVFSSTFARDRVAAALELDLGRAAVLPQGNYQNIGLAPAARARTRARLGIGEDRFAVLGVGFGDIRKGFDLFMQIARRVINTRPDVHFIWVGEIQPLLKTHLALGIEAARATGRFHHIGFNDQVADYYAAADAYALTSREDPYPTVALEAVAAGVPVVAFEQSGGIPALLRAHDAGAVAAFEDPEDFRAKLLGLLNHARLAANRPRLAAVAARHFSQPAYAADLLRLAQPGLASVSVCVLNYNYAGYLRPRLDSIFAQTHPVHEVLFFDDGSADHSVALARDISGLAQRDMTIFANETNTGAILAQWRRAAQTAQGDYIWLAEADDLADPAFLSRVLDAMAAADGAVLGFSDSRVIDAAGRLMSASYQPHYRAAGAAALGNSGSWAAADFAAKFLAVQNLIYNVSAVVWRREALLAALEACGDLASWQLAGDWRVYLQLLTAGEGSVAYVAESLNSHRRHEASRTRRLPPAQHIEEIRRVHAFAANRLQLKPARKAEQAAYLSRIKTESAPRRKTARARPVSVASTPKD